MIRTNTPSYFAFALLALVFSGLVVGQQGNTIERNIVVGTNGAGNCTVTTAPADIQSARRNFKVVWNVTNNCSGARRVTVDNFVHEADNKKKDPVQIDDPGSIPQGGAGAIKGRIKNIPNNELGTYKYDVLIDGNVALDPKIDIDG